MILTTVQMSSIRLKSMKFSLLISILEYQVSVFGIIVA